MKPTDFQKYFFEINQQIFKSKRFIPINPSSKDILMSSKEIYSIFHYLSLHNSPFFKDKHDGCYERPEYFLLKLYRKGSTFNCMIVRHMDVTKELNSPDGPQGKAAASAYNYWIKKKSLNYPKIMLESHHTYFSRLTGGTWHTVKRFINPKLLNAPQSKFFSEETSEYHKLNISQFPDHQQTMSKWIFTKCI